MKKKSNSNKSNSNKSSSYDEAVVEIYKRFVGEDELKKLSSVFSSEKFIGVWKQALCSPSTIFLGTGPNFSSVQARYDDLNNGLISVKNDAYDNNFFRVSITGTSRARVRIVPMCRTVEFDNLFNVEGDYWVLYATPSFNTIIVCAPIIIRIFNRPVVITKNFGFYVLTRNVKDFWSTSAEYEATFNALKKYGFNKIWNKPVATAETYKIQ
jgi:lipocalin